MNDPFSYLGSHDLDALDDSADADADADADASNRRGSPPQTGADRQAVARALADLEATRARVERDAERLQQQKKGELVLELLPVLDNLERAITTAESDETSGEALIHGLRLVLTQLEQVLVRFGVERVDAAGATFDPASHQAISATPVADPDLVGLVLHQLAPGYRLGGKLLRPAQVTVGVRVNRSAHTAFTG